MDARRGIRISNGNDADTVARRARELRCYAECVVLGELDDAQRKGKVSAELREILDCQDCGEPYHLCACDDFDSLFDADELGIDPEA